MFNTIVKTYYSLSYIVQWIRFFPIIQKFIININVVALISSYTTQTPIPHTNSSPHGQTDRNKFETPFCFYI